jgi:protein-arginine kinase activator protein McsA
MYAVVTCPGCKRSFIIKAHWKRVQCRYCGMRFKPQFIAVYKRIEDAQRALRARGFRA